MDKKFTQILSFGLVLFSFPIILLGAFVRATDAGLSCPDWPLCFGMLIPDNEKFSILGVPQEYIHRVLASLLGLLCISLAFVCFRSTHKNTKHAFFLLVLVIVQGVFGGLTVLLKLNPFIVSTHMALGTIFFISACLFWIQPKWVSFKSPESDWFYQFICGLMLLTFCQMVLGAFVGSSGSALVCPNIPNCSGQEQALSMQQSIHMLHRVLGLIIFASVSLIWIMCYKISDLYDLRHYFAVLFNLVVIQVLLGSTNVALHVPIPIAILHLATALFILLLEALLVRTCFLDRKSQKPFQGLNFASTQNN